MYGGEICMAVQGRDMYGGIGGRDMNDGKDMSFEDTYPSRHICEG